MPRPKLYELTDKDIQLIQKFMDENITGQESMPGRIIFEKVENQLSYNFPQASFVSMLSAAVREDRITGFEGRKRLGYVVKGTAPKAPKTSAPKAAEHKTSNPKDNSSEELKTLKEENAHLQFELQLKTNELTDIKNDIAKKNTYAHQKSRLSVCVSEKHYEVPMSFTDIQALIVTVLQGEKNSEGQVKFNNHIYKVNDPKLLERFLLCFFESTLLINGKKNV